MACVVINKESKVLLLKRSPDKKLSPNKWFVVGAAPLDENEDMQKIALREIRDELGVNGKILTSWHKIKSEEKGQEIIVTPFLALIGDTKLVLNNEHVDYEWVDVDEIKNYDTIENTEEIVKGLMKKWKNFS